MDQPGGDLLAELGAVSHASGFNAHCAHVPRKAGRGWGLCAVACVSPGCWLCLSLRLQATTVGRTLISSPFLPLLPFPSLSTHPHLQVHGECETVRTSFRPVPLTWHFCHATPPPPAKRSGQRGGRGASLLESSDSDGSGSEGSSGGASPGASPGARLLPLLDPSGRRINPALLPPDKRFNEEAFDEEWGRWDGLRKAKVSGLSARLWCREHRCVRSTYGVFSVMPGARQGGWDVQVLRKPCRSRAAKCAVLTCPAPHCMRTIEGFLESVDRAGKRRAQSAQATALAPLPPRVCRCACARLRSWLGVWLAMNGTACPAGSASPR